MTTQLTSRCPVRPTIAATPTCWSRRTPGALTVPSGHYRAVLRDGGGRALRVRSRQTRAAGHPARSPRARAPGRRCPRPPVGPSTTPGRTSEGACPRGHRDAHLPPPPPPSGPPAGHQRPPPAGRKRRGEDAGRREHAGGGGWRRPGRKRRGEDAAAAALPSGPPSPGPPRRAPPSPRPLAPGGQSQRRARDERCLR